MPIVVFCLGLLWVSPAWAEPGSVPLNIPAIGWFVASVVVLLSVMTHIARQSREGQQWAGAPGVSGFRNGLAIAGDYITAASMLGISAAVHGYGFDGLVYAVGFLTGWPLVLFLFAERLRNLGRYSFADVVSYRFSAVPVRALAATSTLVVVLFYLSAQMVGAGQLFVLLFNLPYAHAQLLVGGLLILYVLIGGMPATTGVQVAKAILLLGSASTLAFLILERLDGSLLALFARAEHYLAAGVGAMSPGGFLTDPVSVVSFGLALMLGTAGLPHVLMRFLMVPDAKEARRSVAWATGWIGMFYLLTFIIGFGAIVLVGHRLVFANEGGELLGGGNMAAVHLAAALGGDVLLGVFAAATFVTILAVVAGLTLSGASAVAHDFYARVICRGKPKPRAELWVSRGTTLLLGIAAIFLGVLFEHHNIAFIVALAFGIAASVGFPVLSATLLWRGCTTRGAVAGGCVGLVSAVVLTIASRAIWVDVLGFAEPLFPYASPVLFTVPAAFGVLWLVSVTDRTARAKEECAAFPAQEVRIETGLGVVARRREAKGE